MKSDDKESQPHKVIAKKTILMLKKKRNIYKKKNERKDGLMGDKKKQKEK